MTGDEDTHTGAYTTLPLSLEPRLQTVDGTSANPDELMIHLVQTDNAAPSIEVLRLGAELEATGYTRLSLEETEQFARALLARVALAREEAAR